MNELFYFTFADLMIRVEYNADANTLRYASHRKITFDERVLVEQYLLSTVALKTDYYKKTAGTFRLPRPGAAAREGTQSISFEKHAAQTGCPGKKCQCLGRRIDQPVDVELLF